MINIGTYQTLTILRETSVGLYLADNSGEDVLLPKKYCPERFDIYGQLEVFVYRDNAGRKIATTLTPDITLHEFGLLQVVDIGDVGAFMDWGLEKHLLVPFSEQREEMEIGNWYVVYLDLDEKTDRLFGTTRIAQKLNNTQLTAAEGDEVDLMIFKSTDLGYSVIVNNIHEGLVFSNEVFKPVRVGDKLRGFVKKIREENKLDISLQPIGYRKFNDANADLIIRELQNNRGFLPVNDQSSPDEIYAQFGISKKAFKKAIGALYKERKIALEDDGIKLIEKG